MTTRRSAVTASALLLSLAGCGPSGAEAPPLFTASVDDAPPGYQKASCDRVAQPGPGRTVSLVLPDDFEADPPLDGDCQFGGDGIRVEVIVGPSGSLASYRQAEVDPYVGLGGDEEVFDPVYRSDVAVFGARRGETLSFGIANDGEGGELHFVQVEGVRIRFDTPPGAWGSHRSLFDAVRGSVAVSAAQKVR